MRLDGYCIVWYLRSLLWRALIALFVFSVSFIAFWPTVAAAIFQPSAPRLLFPETHAEHLYGHYTQIPQSLAGLIVPEDCPGDRLCETLSGSGEIPVTMRYNAYVYSKSNPSGRMSASYVVNNVSGTLVAGFKLSYDANGEVATKETFAETDASRMSCERTAYVYDSLGRLVYEDRTSCGETALSDIGETNLSYDASGNNTLSALSGRDDSDAPKMTRYSGVDRIEETYVASVYRRPDYSPRGGILSDGSESFAYTDEARLLSRQAGDEEKRYAYLPDGLLWETRADGASGIYLYRAGAALLSRARILHSGAPPLRQAQDSAIVSSLSSSKETHLEVSHNFWFDGLNARTVTGSASDGENFDYGFQGYSGSLLNARNANGETDGLRRYGYAGTPYRGTASRDNQIVHRNDVLKDWPLGYAEGYEDRLAYSHPLTFFGVREQAGGRFLERDTNREPLNGYVYADDAWPNKIDATGHAAEPVFAGEGVYGESSRATDLPTCDELNLDCQMPALPDTSPSNDHDNGTSNAAVRTIIAAGMHGTADDAFNSYSYAIDNRFREAATKATLTSADVDALVAQTWDAFRKRFTSKGTAQWLQGWRPTLAVSTVDTVGSGALFVWSILQADSIGEAATMLFGFGGLSWLSRMSMHTETIRQFLLIGHRSLGLALSWTAPLILPALNYIFVSGLWHGNWEEKEAWMTLFFGALAAEVGHALVWGVATGYSSHYQGFYDKVSPNKKVTGIRKRTSSSLHNGTM